MKRDAYNKIPALNNSGMEYLKKSPAHYKAWREGLIERTSPALELGIAIHRAVLEFDQFIKNYGCLPDTSYLDTPAQKAGLTKEAKKEVLAAGKIPLAYSDWKTAMNIADTVMNHPYARCLIEESEKEQVHVWTDEDTGAACKGITDLSIPDTGIVTDLKTLQDASFQGFSQSVARYEMHRQAAFYLDGCKARQFNFIAVEKNPPYGVIVYSVPQYIIELGRELYKPLCRPYQQCMESGERANYTRDISDLYLPAWAIPDGAESLTMNSYQ